jgi:hypothetical protein
MSNARDTSRSPSNGGVVRQVEPNVRYQTGNERLMIARYCCSFALPPGSAGVCTDLGNFSIEASASSIGATLYLSTADNLVVRGWVDEAFRHHGVVLNPAGAEQVAGVRLRSFASDAYVGCKARVQDVFSNRFGVCVTGPVAAGREVLRFTRGLLASIEFHDPRPVEGANFVDAATEYLNAPLSTGADSFLYLARHAYLLRPGSVSAFGALVRQMRAERHPGSNQAAQRLDLLSKARQALDEGEWETIVSELRGRVT